MSDRRHTDKPDLNPAGVMSLDINHAAMRENRTLFPSTVVTVTADAPDRLLVSGRNNRKIGATVEKGKFKGYGIYCLSLEERATCPEDCSARGFCFGNGMQMARRHRIGDADVFFDRLGFEIMELLDEEPAGLSIRLHVLGDFPSVEYVSFWKEVLDENPNVMCWGYTHRAPTNWGGDEIGDAIQAVKDAHPERFRIRWSTDVARPDSAIILDHVPRGARGPNQEIVCPAQTDATACCATCSLCWGAPNENIGFIKHGRVSADVEAEAVTQAMSRPAPARQSVRSSGRCVNSCRAIIGASSASRCQPSSQTSCQSPICRRFARSRRQTSSSRRAISAAFPARRCGSSKRSSPAGIGPSSSRQCALKQRTAYSSSTVSIRPLPQPVIRTLSPSPSWW
jgi:hypothetical protein